MHYLTKDTQHLRIKPAGHEPFALVAFDEQLLECYRSVDGYSPLLNECPISWLADCHYSGALLLGGHHGITN